MDDGFGAVPSFGLTKRNGTHIKYLLARMTAWLEARCGGALTFAELVSRARRYPFEIEHIWADQRELHPEFPSEQAFADQRNGFGGLLLLTKDFNASYGAKPYREKLEHCYGQNVLAKSLHPNCYTHNPTFLRLRDEHGLAFLAIPDDFTVASFAERQAVYQKLCEVIWDPANFGIEVPQDVDTPAANANRPRYYGLSVKDLLDAGLVHPGQRLVGTRNAVSRSATITAEGQIELEDGRREESPSMSGATALGIRACNGWHFWQTDGPTGLCDWHVSVMTTSSASVADGIDKCVTPQSEKKLCTPSSTRWSESISSSSRVATRYRRGNRDFTAFRARDGGGAQNHQRHDGDHMRHSTTAHSDKTVRIRGGDRLPYDALGRDSWLPLGRRPSGRCDAAHPPEAIATECSEHRECCQGHSEPQTHDRVW